MDRVGFETPGIAGCIRGRCEAQALVLPLHFVDDALHPCEPWRVHADVARVGTMLDKNREALKACCFAFPCVCVLFDFDCNLDSP